MTSRSAHSSRGSEDSTSASNEPGCESSGNASPTPTGDECSSGTGAESIASRTFETYIRATRPHGARGGEQDDERWEQSEITPPLTPHGQGSVDPALAVSTSSAAGSRVRTSPSPASEQDSQASAPAFSTSSCESPMSLFGPEGMSSLRTYPDYFPPTVAEISPSFSRRWPTSGFTTSPTECWTADTSECPSDGGASTSLADVLAAECAPRFYLSPRAAAGILRRAEKRGRELPRALESALRALSAAEDADIATTSTAPEPTSLESPLHSPEAAQQEMASASPDDAKRTTRTSSPRRSRPASGARGSTTPTPRLDGSSPTPSAPRASTPPRTEPDEERPLFLSENQRAEVLETTYARQLTGGGGKPGQGYPAARIGSQVRRLTPTECERLQGFPDGWTATSR